MPLGESSDTGSGVSVCSGENLSAVVLVGVPLDMSVYWKASVCTVKSLCAVGVNVCLCYPASVRIKG